VGEHDSPERIAVVGGSLAGLRAAEQLRAAGHGGPITVYGEESHLPYNRPPLSKEVLADPERDSADSMFERLAFRRRSSTADVDFRLGARVDSADLAAGTLTLADGSVETYAGLVAASGLRPRVLRTEGPTAGRHWLRTIDDCLNLKRSLGDPRDVVVIGAGFIGCETACTLHKLGHRVTIVEPTGAPMNRVLGVELAAAVQDYHTRQGISFVIGPGVAGFTGDERVTGVTLDTGQTLPADLVVESVGSLCNTEWLGGNASLDLTDGVLVDNDLAIVGAERAVAVGDIARFPNPLFDEVPRRVEHWNIPTDTAKRAAATLVAQLTGTPHALAPFAPVPAFWSDQFDLRFQSYGSPGLADTVEVVEGDLGDLTSGLLTRYTRAGRLVGSVALNLSGARQRDLRNEFVAMAPA
jgi:3-phenylpropionate/trans-cinnamate dioxygenase ferredoxin reductase subunit